MVIANPRLGVVVTAAPGTASTALRRHLLGLEGSVAVPATEGAVAAHPGSVDAKHATLRQLVAAGVVEPGDLAGMTVVTTTRNPFDFWVAEWWRSRTRWIAEVPDPSSWVHRVPGMLDQILEAALWNFPTWVDARLGADAASGIVRHVNEGHVDEAAVVLRSEELSDGLVDLIGPAGRGVARYNDSQRRQPYWQHYDHRARELVGAVHRPDLERFGYEF